MICYTDGACSGNGKTNSHGGYGVVVLDDNENLIQCYQHFEDGTTNNRQEMKAIIWAMVHFGKKGPLTIYSDSSYSVNTFEIWMYIWAANGWLKSDNKTPENLDLVQAYYNLIQKGYKCELLKVKGHAGNKWNQMADDLATGRTKAIWNMNLKLETIHPQKGDVILLRFDINEIDLCDVHTCFNYLQEIFPNNQLICIPSNIELTLQDRQTLFEYLMSYEDKKKREQLIEICKKLIE